MRGVQDCSARRLVDAARLHTDQAVLDDVDTANAVRTAELVELLEERNRLEYFAVDRDGRSFREPDCDKFGLDWSFGGRDRNLVEVVRGRGPRVLERTTFMAQVQ